MTLCINYMMSFFMHWILKCYAKCTGNLPFNIAEIIEVLNREGFINLMGIVIAKFISTKA